MKVVKCLHQLLGDLLNCTFRQPLIVLKYIKQLSLSIFRDHTEFSVSLKGIKHQNNVLVVQLSQYSYLLTKIAHIFFAFSMLRDKLHSNGEACVLPSRLCQVDLCGIR